jgi:hypothetical protein
MLLQISPLNQLAQMQLDSFAIGGQEGNCVGNGDPDTLPGDGQHLFLQRHQLFRQRSRSILPSGMSFYFYWLVRKKRSQSSGFSSLLRISFCDARSAR